MTFGQSPHTALDQIIRQARYLLISFDGPIRSAITGNPPASHIYDAVMACRESGRSAAVISTTPAAEVRAYLDAHDLTTQITLIAPTIGEAASALDASPADCATITSSPSDIEAAQAAGAPAIAYARTPDEAEHLAQVRSSTA
jgi:beta-phosphoglucomutase-like phosphatase (HAD superfamily)